jgi:hypothetical protein
MKSRTANRTSAVGFGSTTESRSQYMNNLLKQHKRFSPEQVTEQQTKWFHDYSHRNYSYSLQDLLQCEHNDLTVDESPIINWTKKSNMHLQPLIQGNNGFWHISVFKNTLLRDYDFTISVSAGGVSRFHPEAIKHDITKKYGSMIYSTWRSMILDDLPSLMRLVECIRNKINYVAPSITCSDSSARLCRRVGIPVRNDIAFLFPSSYS